MRAYKVGQDRFTSGPMAFHSASGIVAFENEDERYFFLGMISIISVLTFWEKFSNATYLLP